MFGNTTACVDACREMLSNDYEVLVFHATGTGGKTMEALADSGLLGDFLGLALAPRVDHFHQLLDALGLSSVEERRVDRARRHQHDHRSCHGHDQPTAKRRNAKPERRQPHAQWLVFGPAS